MQSISISPGGWWEIYFLELGASSQSPGDNSMFDLHAVVGNYNIIVLSVIS